MERNKAQLTKWNKDGVVLCTAEPYGFGPTTALWSVYIHLRQRVRADIKWHYVGCRHTLSIHVDRDADTLHGWDVVHDIDVLEEHGTDSLKDLCTHLQPIIFVSVLDHHAAEVALKTGIPLIVIDPILWWFPEIPPGWQQAQLVLAPDWFGVKERVEHEGLSNTLVVPPLAPALDEKDCEFREGMVINFGGLQNPLTDKTVHVDYARLMYRCAREAIDLQCEKNGVTITLQVWASPEIVQSLPEGAAVTATPEQARAGMQQCALLCITPGLGNLFDAAACAMNVLLLPPTNDSQGQQAEALQRELNVKSCIPWHKLTEGEPVDYHKPLPSLVEDITKALYYTRDDDHARARLSGSIGAAIEAALNSKMTQRTLRPLISKFGADDGSVMASIIAERIQKIHSEPDDQGHTII